MDMLAKREHPMPEIAKFVAELRAAFGDVLRLCDFFSSLLLSKARNPLLPSRLPTTHRCSTRRHRR
jgi:hypothetical protein